MRTGNPTLNNFQNMGSSWDREISKPATLNGILNKTTLGITTVMAIAVFAFLMIPYSLILPIGIASGLATIVVAIVVGRKTKISMLGLSIYAFFEGLFIGAISKSFEIQYPGIVAQAVLATFVVALVTLAVYRFTGMKVSSKVRRMVGIATISLMMLYLVNLALSLLGIHTGVIETGGNAGMLSIGISIFATLLATFNLVIDFDDAKNLVINQAPEEQEWRIALSLVVTLVWLYVELLRLLSYLRKN